MGLDKNKDKAKKRYLKPNLILYGTIAELTKGSGGSFADGGSTFQGFGDGGPGAPPDDRGKRALG